MAKIIKSIGNSISYKYANDGLHVVDSEGKERVLTGEDSEMMSSNIWNAFSQVAKEIVIKRKIAIMMESPSALWKTSKQDTDNIKNTISNNNFTYEKINEWFSASGLDFVGDELKTKEQYSKMTKFSSKLPEDIIEIDLNSI